MTTSPEWVDPFECSSCGCLMPNFAGWMSWEETDGLPSPHPHGPPAAECPACGESTATAKTA